jgi:hypothetical protein
LIQGGIGSLQLRNAFDHYRKPNELIKEPKKWIVIDVKWKLTIDSNFSILPIYEEITTESMLIRLSKGVLNDFWLREYNMIEER